MSSNPNPVPGPVDWDFNEEVGGSFAEDLPEDERRELIEPDDDED